MDAPRFSWTSAALTDVGLVRRINEDACLAAPESGLWVVADGMGGHALGDMASAMVIDALRSIAPASLLMAAAAAVRERLQAVNTQLRQLAASRDLPLVGSTVAVLLAREGTCAVLWAGDSRVYLLRRGSLLRITRDHSQRELQRLAGMASMPASPAPNAITRAVGAADTLALDEKC